MVVYVGADSGASDQEEEAVEASPQDGVKLDTDDCASASQREAKCACPPILHGDPLTDRKSTFQAHVAEVQTTDEVSDVLPYVSILQSL